MLTLSRIADFVRSTSRRVWQMLHPCTAADEFVGATADTFRSRRDLIVENAVLRHQINVLRRRAGRPRLGAVDRFKLLLGAALLPGWRKAVAIMQPETLLRWYRTGFRLFWRMKSRSRRHRESRLAPETIDLIRDMANRGRVWGAERIRGELLKLGIKVSKRTIQKYMAAVRRKGGGQDWSTFLKNHAEGTWVCDFVQSYDIFFRQVFAFFIVQLSSRRVVHISATRNPTQAWAAQQMRNAMLDAEAPQILIRDRDDKFGAAFDNVVKGAGGRVIKTAIRTPNMNAVAERFVGSFRREVLDNVLVFDANHLDRLGREYQAYFNNCRPHQGLGQRIPISSNVVPDTTKPIAIRTVLGGLHVDYRRAA